MNTIWQMGSGLSRCQSWGRQEQEVSVLVEVAVPACYPGSWETEAGLP